MGNRLPELPICRADRAGATTCGSARWKQGLHHSPASRELIRSRLESCVTELFTFWKMLFLQTCRPRVGVGGGRAYLRSDGLQAFEARNWVVRLFPESLGLSSVHCRLTLMTAVRPPRWLFPAQPWVPPASLTQNSPLDPCVAEASTQSQRRRLANET